MKQKALNKSVEYMKDWLHFLYERGDTPGFVIAVSHQGKVLFNEAYGYADLEKKEKMTPQHVFRIASHSKTFTATAIMQLQEQGKLKIDDRVIDYLSWLKDHKDKRFRNITIRQLLSHGAGIIRDGLDSGYWSLERPFPDAEQFKREMLETKLVIDNNTKLKYSNYGYTLLGLIVEAVSGESYNGYVTKYIVGELDLKNTGPEYDVALKSQIVTGYTSPDYAGKKRLPIANIDTYAMSSATGFYSTAEDICAYFSAHIIGSGRLLNDESKKEMQRMHWEAENLPEKEGYGLGFEIEFTNERRTFGHGGGFPGHITHTMCDPKADLVVTVLTNAAGSRVTYMCKSILKLLDFFQDKWKPPEHGIERYEGRYMDLWLCVNALATGNKLFLGNSGWETFEYLEELEYVANHTFKITKANSYSSEGEEVIFDVNEQGMGTIMHYAGTATPREKDYIAQTKNLRKIGEKFEPK